MTVMMLTQGGKCNGFGGKLSSATAATCPRRAPVKRLARQLLA
jgi:hypothetical protein